MTIRISIAARALAIGVVVALTLAGTAMGEVSREGLVGEWHFDGDAKDSSGNGNDGIIYGATFVDGKLGKALSFDGVGDYVEIQDSNTLDITSQITIGAWVKFEQVERTTDLYDWLAIITKNHYNSAYGLMLCTDSSGCQNQRPLRFYHEGLTQKHSSFDWSDVTRNKWYYIVVTYDGSKTQHFINGELKASNPTSGKIATNNKPIWIGKADPKIWGPYTFDGIIDEVRIYNRALRAEEINANYKAGQTTLTITKTASPTPTPATTTPEPTSSAVLLHGEKTDVVLGEDVLLKLSAVNLITKPPMTVQVMIYPPSGMSVTSSEFVKSGAGIYTTTYSLNPGDGKDIEVRIKTNQVGDFNVKGRIVYYFGDNQSTAEDHTLNLPIKVRNEGASTQNEGTPAQKQTLGFGIIISISAVLFIFLKKRSRR